MEYSSIRTLQQYNADEYDQVASVLIRIADNILKNGSVEKYRSIGIDSKTFQEKLLPYDGAIQCLIEMGFQEDNERFTFFDGTNIKNLEKIRNELDKQRTRLTPVVTPEIRRSQSEVLARLKSHFQHCRIYENPSLQEKARSVIPVQELHSKAQRRSSRPSDSNAIPSLRHCLILELLAWFKRSFFTWTNAPKCTNCHTDQKPNQIGMLSPTPEDRGWWASRVEGYRCPSCFTTLRFPRYNHPEKLLQTRTGRCGEWANCFTLLCRSMGFEARYVLDWTDHVWTEVFIPEWNRWVHCDPCENACDRPLMYEQGWKKKLSLVVGASAEELIDVTWRYSVERGEVRGRRTPMFNEAWLVDTIKELNQTTSIALSPARRRELERRREEETKEFNQLKQASTEDYQGRTSGALEWRLARGETHGGTMEQSSKMIESSPLEFTQSEVESGCFHVEYSSSVDEYKRISNDNETLIGWDAMTLRSCDMMRKEEFDWKKTYLCRREGSREGYLSWKVMIPSGYRTIQVQIRVESSTFDAGKVSWLLCSDRTCDVIKPGQVNTFSSEYQNSRFISLHSFLKGGEGDTAWQKGQLFREATDEQNTSFMILVRIGKLL